MTLPRRATRYSALQMVAGGSSETLVSIYQNTRSQRQMVSAAVLSDAVARHTRHYDLVPTVTKLATPRDGPFVSDATRISQKRRTENTRKGNEKWENLKINRG
jgi:hypothetical protein